MELQSKNRCNAVKLVAKTNGGFEVGQWGKNMQCGCD